MIWALIPLIAIAVSLALLFLWIRSRAQRTRAEMASVLSTDPAVLGPEPVIYRGSNGEYPRVKGNGQLALTRRHLVLRMLVGKGLTIPIADITGTHEDKWFEGAMSGNRQHLIVETTTGEVGFFVRDNAAWIAAIDAGRGTSRADEVS